MRIPLGRHAVSPCGWKKPGAGRGWSVHFAVSVRLFSVKHPAGDGSVTVDTPVAQEGPVAAKVFQLMKVHLAEQNLFIIVGRFSKHAAAGMVEDRPSPDFEALAGIGIAAYVATLDTN